MSGRAWLLNFDADEELARPQGYQPRTDLVARFAELVARVGPLVPPQDLVLDAARPPVHPVAAGRHGRAFCPTPRALAALRAAGARVPDAPSLEVLREVNDRGFSSRLGFHLPGAAYVHTMAELEGAIAAPSPTGRWRLRRAFAFAGRGRLDVPAGQLTEGTRRWAGGALAIGGVEIAPRCDRAGDFGLHGFVGRDGAVCLGTPTEQRIDDAGAWCKTAPAGESALADAEREQLEREARITAEALRRAGYFGPFGIDAFRWRDPAGELRFVPRCDVNARYSMGWAIGMGAQRPDL